MSETETNVYNDVGGMETFRRIAHAFYNGVKDDPLLRPLYPEELDEAEENLALFLAQYWGGPTSYSDKRGHPRLRMRHRPFVIGQEERDAWVRHMLAAVDEVGIEGKAGTEMRRYFREAATFLMNKEG